MIPFGLSSLMTVSMPIGRRTTKCLVPGASAVYLMNEGSGTTLRDYSGNGRDGTLGATTAAPTWTAEGLSFDGGDVVKIPNLGALMANGGTLMVVLKPGADVTTTQYFLSVGSDVSAAMVHYIRITAGKVGIFAGGTAAGTYLYSADGAITPETWVSVAGTTIWGGEIATYVNGAQSTAGTTSGTFTAPGDNKQFIGAGPGPAYHFTGDIAAAIVYPFALTPAQVSQNHNALRNMLLSRGVDIPFDYGGGAPASSSDVAALIQFDDARASVYDTAYPILAAAGIKATVYAISSLIGTPGYCTEAELLELDAAGWDIANHCNTHAHLPTLSAAQQQVEFETCAAYLDGLGLTRASKHVAYPYGENNADTLTAMAAAGMLTGRTTAQKAYPDTILPIAAPYQIPISTGLNSGAPMNYIAEKIASARPDDAAILYGHDVFPDTDGATAWKAATLQALADYIVASGCRVVTISQLWDYVQAGYVWP